MHTHLSFAWRGARYLVPLGRAERLLINRIRTQLRLGLVDPREFRRRARAKVGRYFAGPVVTRRGVPMRRGLLDLKYGVTVLAAIGDPGVRLVTRPSRGARRRGRRGRG